MLSNVRSKMAKFWHLCTDQFHPHKDPTYHFGRLDTTAWTDISRSGPCNPYQDGW